jgi:formate dehydrogenase major subunit
MAYRNHDSKIVFDFDDPMGESTCVACGECVQACPTGALMPSVMLDENQTRVTYPDKKVDSLCPFCGVGCQVTYQVKDDKVIYAEGRDGPANHNRLCVKGRFGFDYIHHPHRLTKPLVRLPNASKDSNDQVDPANPFTHFREASWEEALDIAAKGLVKIRDQKGVKALAGFGSAKGSNEEAYLFQKLVRTGFGSNNVDHCTRLCHASSVAALMEGLNSGAVSAPFSAAMDAEVIIVIGANPTINHPVAATFIKNAAKRGAKLIVMDPRRQSLSRHAHLHLAFKAGSDVAMLNAMINTIITEGLTDEQYIAGYTEGFDELKERIKEFTPEKMEPICGIPAETLREVARLYARSRASIIFWGMGISQHVHGTDNARCLIALALITGQVGRPGTGLHPLRGQNNVQGASDAGLIPMFLPDSGSRSGARPHRGRDHQRDPRRRDHRHVYRGRESRDVGPRPAARAAGAGQAGASGGAGSVRHRDRISCRRDPAGLGVCGEIRHLHQYRPPRAAGARGDQAARRRAAGSVDHPGNCQAHGTGLAL